MFKSVLVANRGEIACRIMRTATAMGLRTIAVYSNVDEHAAHVRMADEAYLIGEAEAALSYLDGAKILDVAREAGAECIHPGYGFLSENAEFSDACKQAGIIFVGPEASAIKAMGLKDRAKALMEKVGVPVVPGIHGSDQSAAELGKQAGKIGYPLLIKAVAGGGGKGMRKVAGRREFASELAACQREAKNAFGDDVVLLEKFIENPRHIEIQIFGDTHGNYVHLFERDCSVQRRHQKVVEEAPAPGMCRELREAMGEAAIAAARAVEYHGAGTVEFIVPGAGELNAKTPFYFMEMNTRLQVEHPVTEAVTGVDLVEWQLRVAAGEVLPRQQDELSLSGHSIEVRLYAEDPANEFLPSPGKIQALIWPQSSDDSVRIDTGVSGGDDVPRFYDPMLAKLIVKADTRATAIEVMVQALQQTAVLGVKTNVGFLGRLIAHDGFRRGGVDTSFIETHLEDLTAFGRTPGLEAIAVVVRLLCMPGKSSWPYISDDRYSPFSLMTGWQLGAARKSAMDVMIDGVRVSAQVNMPASDEYEVGIAGKRISITNFDCSNPLKASLRVDGTATGFSFSFDDDSLLIYIEGRHLSVNAYDFRVVDDTENAGSGVICAPMTGKLQRLFVAVGDLVSTGDRLAVVEAMKMEHPLTAGITGVVKELRGAEGDQVGDGDIVIIVEAETVEI